MWAGEASECPVPSQRSGGVRLPTEVEPWFLDPGTTCCISVFSGHHLSKMRGNTCGEGDSKAWKSSQQNLEVKGLGEEQSQQKNKRQQKGFQGRPLRTSEAKGCM